MPEILGITLVPGASIMVIIIYSLFCRQHGGSISQALISQARWPIRLGRLWPEGVDDHFKGQVSKRTLEEQDQSYMRLSNALQCRSRPWDATSC